MPTMKQVDDMIAKLAHKYNFSQDDARRFLELPVEVKPKAGKAKPVTLHSGEFRLSKDTSAGRVSAPSAYQNFVKSETARVRDLLLAESGLSKLERGQLQKELGARWKAMSATDKAIYQK